jgi:hypothetical protein
VFPALAQSSIDQVSLECIHSHVPPELMALLQGKDGMVGVIDVASAQVETPEEVADTIGQALQFVPRKHLIACTNCGLAPMSRAVAEAKLRALAAGARHAGAAAAGPARGDLGRAAAPAVAAAPGPVLAVPVLQPDVVGLRLGLACAAVEHGRAAAAGPGRPAQRRLRAVGGLDAGA